ncbi:helix-turn-helix domain-containing protein [Lysobacter sp.]|uniref:helix-turn-helix domain-containing protein n=1 Tax=Lysobacter sp. TaxID=72226 RepID=UPI002D2BCA1A|nr:helix-turn-helix domain-containing protein [Lysobacter sp.]HZX76165.1 helix-turn-helix domain-containing protein [Lysobacter sp.]
MKKTTVSTVNPLTHQVPEACQRIGVSRTILYALIKEGEINPIKIGKRTLIPDSELIRLVDRMQRGEKVRLRAEA